MNWQLPRNLSIVRRHQSLFGDFTSLCRIWDQIWPWKMQFKKKRIYMGKSIIGFKSYIYMYTMNILVIGFASCHVVGWTSQPRYALQGYLS